MFHRKSIRLKGHNYAQSGIYFITLCVQDKECLFGHIENSRMILNEFGQIAVDEWFKTPTMRKNIELDAFIVMPNHIHGIIIIHNDDLDARRGELHSPSFDPPETPLFDPPETPDNHSKGEFNSPQRVPRSPSQTIGAIVRGYKSAATKQINIMMNEGEFNLPIQPSRKIWQRNYYEHIVRNERSHQTISKYIRTNPEKWGKDKFYPNERIRNRAELIDTNVLSKPNKTVQ